MATTNMQIRHLPYGTLHKLAQLLDIPGQRNWKALISAMPSNLYKPEEVSAFEMEGMRASGSPSMSLLTDLGRKCKTVKVLIVWLKKIENAQALDILEYEEEVRILEHPSSKPVRTGASVTFRCKATGYPAPEYLWVKDGIEVPDGINEELTLDCARLEDSGNYVCIVSNRLNVQRSHEVELQVLPSPVNGYTGQEQTPEAKHPPEITRQPQSCILPDGVEFRLVVEVKEGPVKYQWFKDGFILVGQTRTELLFQPFYYRHEGNYCCRVENSAGDALSNTALLQAGRPDDLHLAQSVIPRSTELTQKAADKIALVIGNRDYVRLPLNESPLVHTCNDAKMLASILRTREMGFKVISLMNLTLDEMNQALNIFYSLLGSGVYGLVYFAGHGFEEGGQNYLVPVDSVGDWVPEEAVCAQRILDEMNRYHTELIVFLLDICRKRANAEKNFVMKSYEFPYNAQAVMGFATCPQSEAYERRQDPNGMYMKHLLKYVMNDAKVEDVLHQVAGDVSAEVETNELVERQRPQFHSTTTRQYSLRDPIQRDKLYSEREKSWLEIHHLPQKREIECEAGIKIEIRFEHQNWLSNAIVLCLRVIDLGEAKFCDVGLMLECLPQDCQSLYFHPTSTNRMRQVVQPPDTVARSLPQQRNGPSSSLAVEKISEIYNIQRLKEPLALTLIIKYILKGSGEERTKHRVEVFNFKEFGIAAAFYKANYQKE
ncbi:unnamed protein product [Pocillopora meandrina]|uniref:Mucosa-associated lymphoid tissue lymphoma translocation protein 1 n=1 Tax=Pocillopora meandrina TaxID=46732 RepID=A0AAU9VPZ2_9CNID|nr:unnamed protein product [Pocillopora meandrina]